MAIQVTAGDVSLSKPVLGYHGSNSKLKTLIPREVMGLDSIGTWVTLSPKAARMYGPNVHQVTVPTGRYMRAHSDDFYKMFVNLPLVDKHFSKEDAKIIKDGFLFGKAVNEYGKVLDWKGVFRPAWRNAAYMKDWRKLIQSAGYNGVVWARSRIDLQKEDKPHTVMLIFEHKPMKGVLMKEAQLRKQLIRLAHEKPDLRPHILPILKEGAELPPLTKGEVQSYAEETVGMIKKDIDIFLKDLIQGGQQVNRRFEGAHKKVEGWAASDIPTKLLEKLVLDYLKKSSPWGNDKMAPLLAKIIVHGAFVH